MLYSVVLIAIILASRTWLQPIFIKLLGNDTGLLHTVIITLAAMSPYQGA